MYQSSTSSQRARRVAGATLGLALLAGGVSACGTTAAHSQPAATTSTPSHAGSPVRHMVSHDGHQLAFYVTPGHGPAIVLDAGGGLDHTQWTRIANTLSRQTGSTIITYDRAGIGRSDEVKGPWSPQRAAADLKAGLTNLGVTHDIVLVSHSLAGEVATYFVRDNPKTVAGGVMVDASLPQFYTDGVVDKLVAAQSAQIAKLKKLPHQTKKTRQLLAVAASYGPVSRAYHKMSWPSAVPVNVIASSHTPFGPRAQANLWKAAQRQFAKAAPNRTLTMVKSSHNIPADRPEAVVKSVEKMVHQAR